MSEAQTEILSTAEVGNGVVVLSQTFLPTSPVAQAETVAEVSPQAEEAPSEAPVTVLVGEATATEVREAVEKNVGPLTGEAPVVAPAETRLIPIELTNINLSIELRVPVAVGQEFEKTQSLLQRLREKFGEDTLIEELAQVLSGTIEKVTLSRPTNSTTGVSQPRQANPVQVAIPQVVDDIGNYNIQSTQCPWTNYALKNIDPAGIYDVLYSSPQKRALMTQQDVTMMEAYYAHWYRRQAARLAQPTVSFAEDDLPF